MTKCTWNYSVVIRASCGAQSSYRNGAVCVAVADTAFIGQMVLIAALLYPLHASEIRQLTQNELRGQ